MPAKGVLFRLWIFGSLDPFSMTESIVTRLKGAEHSDWMTLRSGLRHVANNIVGVCPLIVVYLKETGRKTEDDSLVV